MKERLLISFSGGRTSAFMTWWLKEHCSDKYDMLVVFANTGKEREETLQFVERCTTFFGWQTVWVEAVTNPVYGKGVTARVVDYASASRKGEPFEAMIRKHGIPNMTAPKCSRELKAYAIRAYLRSIGWKKYHTAIGIRADEPRRLNWTTAKKNRVIYPLATACPVTKSDINAFWRKQPFDLELKSYEGNCDLCWKKSMRKLMTIATEHPELTRWWKEMEVTYDTYVPDSRRQNAHISLPIRFYRDNKSIDNILSDARQPFERAVDERLLAFSTCGKIAQEPLDDQVIQCSESCEAF